MTGGGFISVALAYFFLGLYRGANSNYCNTVINELAPGRASTMNGLHAMFSIGAFLFPLFLAGITVDSSENWIYACLFMAFSGCISILLFAVCPVTGKKRQRTIQNSRIREIIHGDSLRKGFFICPRRRFSFISARKPES